MKSMVASLLEKGVETTFPPSLQWNETSLQPVTATDKGYSSSSIQISVLIKKTTVLLYKRHRERQPIYFQANDVVCWHLGKNPYYLNDNSVCLWLDDWTRHQTIRIIDNVGKQSLRQLW